MVNNSLKIDINGKQVGLKFAFPQSRWFAIDVADNSEIYFQTSEGDMSLTVTGITAVIETAHRNHCLVKKIKPVVDFEEISDWVDQSQNNEETKNAVLDVISVWEKSEHTKLWAEALKKKVQEILQQIQEESNFSMNVLNQPSTQTELQESS